MKAQTIAQLALILIVALGEFGLSNALAAENPSPAPLRIAIETAPHRLRVLKCRGALVPPAPLPFPTAAWPG